MQQNLQPGTEVVTTAGMYARVVAFEGDDLLLEVAPGVTQRYLKQAIMRVVPDSTAQGAAPTPVVDATPERAVDTPAAEAAATTEAKSDATTGAETKADEPAADGGDGAAATTEPTEPAADAAPPDGKADGAEATKAEESGTAKGDRRSPS